MMSSERAARMRAGSWAWCVFMATMVGWLAGCAVTSPYWDYVPDSTSAPIPFQVWSDGTSAVYVECANDTGAHGNPSAGDASYVAAATIHPNTQPSLDSAGAALYSGSTQVVLPSACWKYFSDYDFWQANVRVVRLGSDGKKVPFSNFDKAGLECLGREVGKAASWFGALNKGCEKHFLGSDTATPYIVLRIDGYANGVASAAAPAPSSSDEKAKKLKPPADGRASGLPKFTEIPLATPEQLRLAGRVAK